MARRFAISALCTLGIAGALTAGAMAYTSYTSYRWPGARATFYFNANSGGDLPASSAIAALQTAMEVWNQQSGSAMRFSYGGTTNANQLANDGTNAMFFRPGSSAIATNYTWWSGSSLVDSDIVFWDDHTFSAGTSGCTSGYYLEDVAAHELGHAMGLDHSSDPEATMYPSLAACSQAFRTLAADDIAGARALYPGGPAPAPNNAPSVSISSPANGASYCEGVSVSFSGSASDSQDGNLTSALQWTDNGYAIGSGGSFSRALTVGSHTIVAYVTDSGGLQGSRSITVTVSGTSSGGTTPSGGTLTARGRKKKGLQAADLSWSGVSSSSLDVYRNGSRVMVTANDGAETDSINQKGGGTYSYQVCAAGTNTCSNPAVVAF